MTGHVTAAAELCARLTEIRRAKQPDQCVTGEDEDSQNWRSSGVNNRPLLLCSAAFPPADICQSLAGGIFFWIGLSRGVK